MYVVEGYLHIHVCSGRLSTYMCMKWKIIYIYMYVEEGYLHIHVCSEKLSTYTCMLWKVIYIYMYMYVVEGCM